MFTATTNCETASDVRAIRFDYVIDEHSYLRGTAQGTQSFNNCAATIFLLDTSARGYCPDPPSPSPHTHQKEGLGTRLHSTLRVDRPHSTSEFDRSQSTVLILQSVRIGPPHLTSAFHVDRSHSIVTTISLYTYDIDDHFTVCRINF